MGCKKFYVEKSLCAFSALIFVWKLSGSAGASFQSRYTIAIVYRLMFFMHRKVSRYTPEGPLSWGIARLC